MSEIDVLTANDVDEDVVVFHEQLVEPIQLTQFTPQLATTVLPSPTITAPSLTSSLPRSSDMARNAQRRANGRTASSTSSSLLSPSFYESGTVSASVSRDHSPQRYPRPPPNMIISPAHRRSLSADRTSSSQYNSSIQRLVKRLSDVIDIDDDVITSGGMTSAAARHYRDNNTERRYGGQQKQQQPAAGSDVRTRDLMTSESGHVSRKAASHTEISSSEAERLSTTSSPTSSTLSASSAGATNSRLSRWTATLALFRKKTRRSDNKQSSSSSIPPASIPSSSSSAAAAAEAAAALARPLHEQCASLSSGDVVASVETCSSRQVHSNLSQSQPLHYSTAASLASPASGLLATTSSSSSSSSRASKLARIIDPLKLRRRPNSSSIDLQTTLTTSSGGEVTSCRPHALASGRPGTRRARYSLTSAYMQGSL